MRAFRDIPIRQKLMVITMATTTAALLLAAIGIVTFDAALFRRSLIFDLSALVEDHCRQQYSRHRL